jgi:DNA topoisomerase-1
VNEYLRELCNQDFTAKDFRTWAGTVLACAALREFEAFDSETQAKKNIVQAIDAVAQRLGNTRSVCRKCYVHPAVLDSYLSGTMAKALEKLAKIERNGSSPVLREEEGFLMHLLQEASSGKK